MGHSHFHRRQHHHRQNDDPFGFANGFSSLEAAAESFFGGGEQNPPATVAAAPSAAAPAGKNIANHLEIRRFDADLGDGPSTVYVTASWTGTGSDFSYSTVTPTAASPQTTVPVATSKTPDPPNTTLRKSTQQKPTPTPKTTLAAATTSITSSAAITSSPTGATVAAATATPSAAATTQDNGLSGGAKAGIAIGVIIGIFALVAAALALYRMKKNRDEEAYERSNSTEKNPFSDNAAVQPPPPIMASMTKPPQTAYTPPATAPSNPFGSGAVPVQSGPVASAPAPASTSGTMTSTIGNAAMAAGAGMAAGAVVGAAAANARRASIPAPLPLNRAQSPALVPPPPMVPSPSGSNFSESSTLTTGAMAAVGGAGAGGPGGPRMHRVQMDFNPTMEDELQISAGEIVRIVREFDDGWGVVPRTCLSRLPLKPRQKRNGPPAAAPQANGPANMNGQPPRSQSPALVANPAQRSMSPGPYGGGPQDRPQRPDNRSRSNSANDAGARPKAAPIGPSPMNPASQAPKEVDLPIQGVANPEELPAPLAPGHQRTASAGSAASGFVRKPVPKKTDV